MLRRSIRNTPEVGQKTTAPPLPPAVAGEPSYMGMSVAYLAKTR